MATYTTITANNLKDIAGKPLNGYVTFTGPVNRAGTAISANSSDGTALQATKTFLVVNGVITGDDSDPQQPAKVLDTSATNPANIGYSVEFFEATSRRRGKIEAPGYECVQPSGSTWSLDDFHPNTVPIALQEFGPVGLTARGAFAAGATYRTRDAFTYAGDLYFVTDDFTAGASFDLGYPITKIVAGGASAARTVSFAPPSAVDGNFDSAAGTSGMSVTSSSTSGSAYFVREFLKPGKLMSIQCTVNGWVSGGALEILVGKWNGGSPIVVDRFTVQVPSAGVNTFYSGADFAPRDIPPGCVIGYYNIPGGVTVQFDGSPSPGCLYYVGNPATGATLAYAPNPSRLDFAATTRYTPESLPQDARYATQLTQFGDSITYGYSTPTPAADCFGALLSNSCALPVTNRAIPGSCAADVWNNQIAPNLATDNVFGRGRMYSLMVGTNDAYWRNAETQEVIFSKTLQGLVSWLTTPRECKVCPGDAGMITLSGTPSPSYSGGGGFALLDNGSFRVFLRSFGKPIYVWSYIQDGASGNYTVSIDGGTPYGPYSSTPVAPINTPLGQNVSMQLAARIEVPAGYHTVDIIWQSGVCGIAGVGTMPSVPAAGQPILALGQIPPALAGSKAADTTTDMNTTVATYNADILTGIAPLVTDGATVRLALTQQFLSGAAVEMSDNLHPNANFGQPGLARAFANALRLPYLPQSSPSVSADAIYVRDTANGHGYKMQVTNGALSLTLVS